MQISVLISAHNPDESRLFAVLRALREQTLPASEWETIVINNASNRWPDRRALLECAPANLSVVDEPILGLSAARRRGFLQAKAEIGVLVDDDNVLAADYLANVAAVFANHPNVGVIGGKSLPVFSAEPPTWTREFFPLLALRDFGDAALVTVGGWSTPDRQKEYPAFAPIGAGMALRRPVWLAWLRTSRESVVLPDRRGGELSSGGDNDIVLGALSAGWDVGYFPQLRLDHLIPPERLQPKYLARLNRGILKSWIHVVTRHHICPWPPLSPAGAALRKCKAWLRHRPWASNAAYVRFHGACGHFDGRVSPQLGANQAVVSPTVARAISRRLSLGRVAYGIWHAPRAAIGRTLASGGPIEHWADRRGRIALERAATTLPPSAADPVNDAELHFLTGKKFWYQTAFCLHTLQRHTGRTFRVVFHDDGSLDRAVLAQLSALFPAAKIRLREENDERLASLLPSARFPFLHDQRRRYPNILKLTDVHVGENGPRLVLDSDMLFFRRPEFVLAWLATPDRPLHMVDIADAYGYSRPLMESLAGSPVSPRVNVGLTGLRSDQIDWERIEFWIRQLVTTEGTQYFLEQALFAMLIAGQPAAIAPPHDYVVAPTRAECDKPTAVLHHYVAESKRWYFRQTWKRALQPPAGFAVPVC